MLDDGGLAGINFVLGGDSLRIGWRFCKRIVGVEDDVGNSLRSLLCVAGPRLAYPAAIRGLRTCCARGGDPPQMLRVSSASAFPIAFEA